MKITNKSGLPDAIVRAMENDPYDSGNSDFTATGLLKPPRMTQLEKIYKDEIQEDAEDGLYRLYGQLVHVLLERANLDDLAERRFFSDFTVNGCVYKVSAQFDTLCLKNDTLTDYKFTTSWGFKKDSGPKPEWIAQLNIQLELLRRNGFDAKVLNIVGLLRDWQINMAKSDQNYPQSPVATHNIPIWTREQTVSFIEMRIAMHVSAEEALPNCTDDDQWMREKTWAVVKNGGKRAINGGVQFSQDLAEAISAKTPGTHVEYRPGKRTRCEDYCAAAPFCSQYQKTLKSESEEEKIA